MKRFHLAVNDRCETFEAWARLCNGEAMITAPVKFAAVFVTALLVTGCERTLPVAPEPSAQDVFFERLTLLCDKAYPGKLVSADAVDAEMQDSKMMMHVARCEQNQIQIPFHIQESDGTWNRSRTWIISRTDDGLQLKHKHRHEDGSLDKVTNYGGDTEGPGSGDRQEFPVDAESINLFNTEGLEQSVINIWAMEISPPGKKDARFSYELRRESLAQRRHFQVDFDLTQSAEIPPPAWGD